MRRRSSIDRLRIVDSRARARRRSSSRSGRTSQHRVEELARDPDVARRRACAGRRGRAQSARTRRRSRSAAVMVSSTAVGAGVGAARRRWPDPTARTKRRWFRDRHVAAVREQVLDRAERERRDRAGRVGRADGDEHAPVDDREVARRRGPSPHGSTTDDSRSSPMRAVPSRWLLVGIVALSIVCAPASSERFGGALGAPGDGSAGVVAEAVGHLRRREPVAVDQRGRELDAVVEVGEVLAQDDPPRATAEPATGGPRGGRRRAPHGRATRTRPRSGRRWAPGSSGCRRRTPGSGSVRAELERVDLAAEVTAVALQVVVEVAVDHHARDAP